MYNECIIEYISGVSLELFSLMQAMMILEGKETAMDDVLLAAVEAVLTALVPLLPLAVVEG